MSNPQQDFDCCRSMPRGVEWGTLALMLGCYALWGGVLLYLPGVSLILTVLCLGCLAGLHSSLTHEALHGHPFRSRLLNEALMFLPLTLFVPYGRFRDTHLAHHRDERLTDPYDDPESKLPGSQPSGLRCRAGLRVCCFSVNNTLLGAGGDWGHCWGKAAFMEAGVAPDPQWAMIAAVVRDWLLHCLGAGLVVGLVWVSPLSLP